jgi:sugar phosphate isomerase/epimerase
MYQLALAPTSLPNTPPLPFIAATAEAGFDAVSLRLYPSPLFQFFPIVGDSALIAGIKGTLAATGLKMLEVHSFYLQPAMDFEKVRAALALGAELGGRYAMVIGDDTDWSRMRDNFGRFCDIAAAVGLTPALEFALMRPLATLPQALRLIADAGRSNAVLSLDPVNLIRSAGTPADLKAVDRRLLPYAQLSDGLLGPGEPNLEIARKNGASERRLMGEGVLPLREILDALPPGIPLSLELPPPSGANIPAGEWAKRVAGSARRFLANYRHPTA